MLIPPSGPSRRDLTPGLTYPKNSPLPAMTFTILKPVLIVSPEHLNHVKVIIKCQGTSVSKAYKSMFIWLKDSILDLDRLVRGRFKCL